MGRKQKYSKEVKLEIVRRYISGESATTLADEFRITGKWSAKQIRTWRNKYEQIGVNAFNKRHKNKTYSKELKEAAITDYFEGNGSLETIANKYGISTHEVLRNWIIKYNSHIEIKDYDPKPEVYMAKSRKTSYEERIEIVKYCLEHEGNYKETAIEYGVNYAQVYTWVTKYKAHGEEGLQDRRGRNIPESEMTTEEKLRHELKKSEAKRKYLEMENAALKKLEEIERQEIREKNKKKSTKRSKH
jgi:transposase-like protein